MRDREPLSQYAFHGYSLQSDLPLRAFSPVATVDTESSVLSLRAGVTPECLDDTVYANPVLQIGTNRQALFQLPSIGRFYLPGGGRVLYSTSPESTPEDLAAAFTTLVCPILLHQLRAAALRATVVSTPKGAIAFLGSTVVGKSTLAAACIEQGIGTLLTEDVARLTMANERAQIVAGCRRLHLWPDSVKALGIPVNRTEPARRGSFSLSVTTSAGTPSQALHAAIFLQIVQTGRPVSLHPLPPIALFQPANVFHSPALSRIYGEQEREFNVMTHLAKHVPAFVLRRPLESQLSLSMSIARSVDLLQQVL